MGKPKLWGFTARFDEFDCQSRTRSHWSNKANLQGYLKERKAPMQALFKTFLTAICIRNVSYKRIYYGPNTTPDLPVWYLISGMEPQPRDHLPGPSCKNLLRRFLVEWCCKVGHMTDTLLKQAYRKKGIIRMVTARNIFPRNASKYPFSNWRDEISILITTGPYLYGLRSL